MCIHNGEDAKYVLDMYGVDNFKHRLNDMKGYQAKWKDNAGVSEYYNHIIPMMERILDEHLHPIKVQEAAQTYINATQAKLDEAAAWAAKMNKLVPA